MWKIYDGKAEIVAFVDNLVANFPSVSTVSKMSTYETCVLDFVVFNF